MKLALKAAVGVFALSTATPAAASIIFDYNTGILTVDGNTTIGDSATISFNGHPFPLNSPAIPGLAADVTLVFQGLDGNNYLFDYIVTNTSGPPNPGVLTIFGFADITPDRNAPSSVTGVFTHIAGGGFPGNPDFEFCVKEGAGARCFGSEGGVGPGQSGSGTLTLGFESPNTQIMMSGPAVRWEGPNPATAVIGSPVRAVVPEPASWATMLMGFAAVGLVVRRRRKSRRRNDEGPLRGVCPQRFESGH
jgi:hypothetical protein